MKLFHVIFHVTGKISIKGLLFNFVISICFCFFLDWFSDFFFCVLELILHQILCNAHLKLSFFSLEFMLHTGRAVAVCWNHSALPSLPIPSQYHPCHPWVIPSLPYPRHYHHCPTPGITIPALPLALPSLPSLGNPIPALAGMFPHNGVNETTGGVNRSLLQDTTNLYTTALFPKTHCTALHWQLNSTQHSTTL